MGQQGRELSTKCPSCGPARQAAWCGGVPAPWSEGTAAQLYSGAAAQRHSDTAGVLACMLERKVRPCLPHVRHGTAPRNERWSLLHAAVMHACARAQT